MLKQTDNKADDLNLSRRCFIKALGFAGVAFSAGGCILLPDHRMVMPNSGGFLVVDFKKCMGCYTCMTSCAIAHSGQASLSLARIQIQQNPFANWPDDISIFICRQCEDAPCVKACPVAALQVDRKNGNIRHIDPNRCIGCLQCFEACPYIPTRIQWNSATEKSQKCDLCLNTPFMEEEGGVGGTQACVKACPVNAIAFVTEMPDQKRADSYDVNLRGEGWAKLGMTRS